MKNVNPMHACYIVVHCTLELLNLHRSILTKPVKISRSMIPVIKVHLRTTILNFISFKHREEKVFFSMVSRGDQILEIKCQRKDFKSGF